MIKFKFIYPLSIVISYFTITNGGGGVGPGAVLGILVYALFLCAPLIKGGDWDKDPMGFWVVYAVWCAMQWAIYYYGLGVPHGVGVPGYF